MTRPAAQRGAEAQARRQNGGVDGAGVSGADRSLFPLSVKLVFIKGCD